MAPTVSAEKNGSRNNNSSGLHDCHRAVRNRRTTRSSSLSSTVSSLSSLGSSNAKSLATTTNCVASPVDTHSDATMADKLQQHFSMLTTCPCRDDDKEQVEQVETKEPLPTVSHNDKAPATNTPYQYFACDHAKASTSPAPSNSTSATDGDEHEHPVEVVRAKSQSKIQKNQRKTKSNVDMRKTALLVVAIKTIHLVKRNQLLQQRLENLQRETTQFINEVMANPENKRRCEEYQTKSLKKSFNRAIWTSEQ